MEDILKRIILENQELIAGKKLIPRNHVIPETGSISVLTGIRRCGKTHVLYEQAKKVDSRRVLFLDFEDERLVTLNTLSGYDVIIDSYKTLFPDLEPVLFFDEVQNLNNWHLYLKRLHVSGYRIFATGSNAHLISREIATFLEGRSLETRIFPFSFREFLLLRDVTLEQKDFYINRPFILNLFDEYLQFGGFPEVIRVAADEKRMVAKNLYNLLFYKDLVARFDKDENLLRLVVSKIAENITKEFSITGLANKIMSVYKTTVPTVTDYFNVLPEPFLTTNLYPYRASFVQRESKRKTYLADNSFIFLYRIAPDHSRLFENLVFCHLQLRYPEMHYYRTGHGGEVDFFVGEGGGRQLIQACYTLGDADTREREIKSLLRAMDEQGLTHGLIYTRNETEDLVIHGKTIRVVPLWQELSK